MSDLLLTEKERRIAAANTIKALDDVTLPHLSYWNYSACEHHIDVGPQVDCSYRKCGGELFAHQRVGTAWLYAVRKGLLASDPGVGKTGQILALIALLKERNELRRRAIIVPNTPAVGQWGQEAARWIPNIKTLVIDSGLSFNQRVDAYASDWDILVIGSHLFTGKGRSDRSDRERLMRLAPFDLVVNDDVDPLLSHDNQTHRAIREISQNATRSFTVNATTLQVRLQQLHAALVPADGYELFGSLKRFESRYVKTELVTEYDDNGRSRKSRRQTGYKNINELKDKISSVYLRHKANELTDIRMPEVMPIATEWLEMSPLQRERYRELQQGVMRLLREEGPQVKHATALTKFTYGQQICAGLPALGEPDVPGASPKLDRLFQRLQDVWADRKVIVYVKNVGMVRAAIVRAQNAGMDCALIWGQKQSPQSREEQKAKFWDDPNCRFLIGTTSLERSHNLQCANTVVGLDTQLNPARVLQLIGRSARAGSSFDRVWVYQYLMAGTQEEGYNQVLARRQAMSDVVFDNETTLFEALSPMELLQLMSP